MKQAKFSIARKDLKMTELIEVTDKKILAIWARDCALRYMHFFTEKFPNDPRPTQAIRILQDWIDTGVFSMKVVRKASLDAHAAAREVGEDNPARIAARAAGQAVATTHVKTHAYGPAIYGQQAIFRASKPQVAEVAVIRERVWQYNHLLELIQTA